MNRNYFHAPRENWIVDEFKKQWDSDPENNSIPGLFTQRNENKLSLAFHRDDLPDVIWLNASWCWRQLIDCFQKFSSLKVLTTIHHIVPAKFSINERFDFNERDKLTNVYHVPNQSVFDFIRPLTKKQIEIIPYWADQNYFVKSTLTKAQLRLKNNIPKDVFLVGSFQRDSEGEPLSRGIIEPKLEKGPDIFCDTIEKLRDKHPNIHVLLTAFRRDYVISRLNEAKIPFSYFEMPSHDKICELYQCLDLYVVASRIEGGPAALIECGLLNVPVISTPVGIASEVLPPNSINADLLSCDATIPQIEHLKLPNGFERYRDLINSL